MSTPTFKDACRLWWRENSIAWKDSYRQLNEKRVKTKLLPQFGDQPVNSITRSDILQYRATLAKEGLANGTINSVMSLLTQILNDAARRYHFVSPCQDINRLATKRVNIDPFTLSEVKEILLAAPYPYQQYYTVKFFTGMRSAEINALLKKDMDMERKQILIRRASVDGRHTSVKTKASDRVIPMNDIVFKAIRDQLNNFPDSDFLFVNRKGKQLDRHNVSRTIWKPLLKSVGLEHRNEYQTRHTCASLMLSSGESPLFVAEILGHQRLETLYEHYSRYIPNIHGCDGEKFEQLIQSGGNHARHSIRRYQ